MVSVLTNVFILLVLTRMHLTKGAGANTGTGTPVYSALQ